MAMSRLVPLLEFNHGERGRRRPTVGELHNRKLYYDDRLGGNGQKLAEKEFPADRGRFARFFNRVQRPSGERLRQLGERMVRIQNPGV